LLFANDDAEVCSVEKAGLWRDIKFNPVPIEEYFHIIDEIGRLVAALLLLLLYDKRRRLKHIYSLVSLTLLISDRIAGRRV